MAERAIPRLTRLLGIVTHLEEHGEATFAELAEHFDVTPEVIKRDIDTLWTAGLPGYGVNDLLDFDGWAYDEGVARITNSQGVHQVRLAPAEAIALIAALGSIVSSGAAPPAAQAVLDKLSGAIAEAGTVTVVPVGDVDPQVADALRTAAEEGTCVTVEYVDARDRRTTRTIEPHRLVTIDGVGYVECFCRRAGDYRTLRLARIESSKATRETQEHPASARQGFELEPAYDVHVTVAADGRWAFEDLPGVRAEAVDGGFSFTVGVSNPDVVVARVLAAGPAVVAVTPPEFAARVRDTADAVIAAHGG